MRNTVITFALCLSSATAFAVNTCDTMPSEKQRESCWSGLINSSMASADEYAFKVEEAKKVPAAVKKQVAAKRKSIVPDAEAKCPKDKLGYSTNDCLLQVIDNFKEFTYKATSKYGVPDLRLD